MKVLIILEDPTLDQYIVKPIVQRMFQDIGRQARVDVLTDPHLRGLNEALDAGQIREIVDENPMVDLFLVVVDRDCDREQNTDRLREREADHPDKLLGCLAIEEVEVWMLAVHDRPGAPWREIRAECDPKEQFAEPFLRGRGWSTDVGRGRKRAMDGLTRRWRRLQDRCPEVRELRDRVAAAV